MLPVSLEWQKSIREPIRGEAFLRVFFSVVAPGARENATPSASSTSPVSTLANVLNDNKVFPQVATLEVDRWDDTQDFILPVNSMTNIGWWALDGSVPQSFTFTFTRNFKSSAITITFDTATNSWATDFEITAYDVSGNVIDSVRTSNNHKVETTVEGKFDEYWKMTINIYKWSRPGWRPRIQNVVFGFMKTFDDAEFFRASQISRGSPIMSSLPEHSFEFTLNNYDRTFNPENPSGLSGYVQQYQKIFVYWGFELPSGEIEWLTSSVYYLREWQPSENILETSMSADSLLAFATKEYDEGIYDGNAHTVYELATKVLQYSEIDQYSEGEPWKLTEEMKSYSTDIPLPRLPCNQLLQLLAMMCGHVLTVDRLTGNIVFQKALYTLVYNDISSKSTTTQPAISMDPILRKTVILVNRPQPTTEVTEIFEESIPVSGETTFDILTDTPYTNQVITVTGAGVSLKSSVLRAYKITITLRGTGTANILITGNEIIIAQIPHVTYENPNVLNGETLRIENPLIASFAVAEELGEVATRLATIRQRLSFSYNGDPALQVFDIYNVQTHFGWIPTIVTEANLSYDGGWTGSVAGMQTVAQEGLPNHKLITGTFDAGKQREVQVLGRRPNGAT